MARFCVVCVDGPAAGWRYVTAIAPGAQLRLVPSRHQLGEWLLVRSEVPGEVVYERQREIAGDDMIFVHYRLSEDGWAWAERLRALEHDNARWIRLFNRLDGAIAHHKRDKGLFADDADEALWAAHDRILAAAAKPEERR